MWIEDGRRGVRRLQSPYADAADDTCILRKLSTHLLSHLDGQKRQMRLVTLFPIMPIYLAPSYNMICIDSLLKAGYQADWRKRERESTSDCLRPGSRSITLYSDLMFPHNAHP